MKPCWSCGVIDDTCFDFCKCAKCVNPEDYEEWKINNPSEYQRWLDSQIDYNDGNLN